MLWDNFFLGIDIGIMLIFLLKRGIAQYKFGGNTLCFSVR